MHDFQTRRQKISLCESFANRNNDFSAREEDIASSRLQKKVKLSLAREQKKTTERGEEGVAHLHSRRVRRELVAHLIRVVGRGVLFPPRQHFLCVKVSQKNVAKKTNKKTQGGKYMRDKKKDQR